MPRVVVRQSVAGLIVLAALASPSAARAQDGDLDRARALYDEAGELERHGKWPAAVEKLRAALKIRETPHLHYALGWALENDDKLLEARAEYELAERGARGTPAGDEVESLARGRRTELEAKTPNIRVIVPQARKRTRIVVDGRETPVQGDGALVPVNPGARVVRVEKLGSAPVERIVYVARGETGTVDLTSDLTPTVRADRDGDLRVGSAEPSTASRHERDRVLPWALVGGGAALVVTSGALFLSSLGDAGQRDDALRAWCTETACTGGNVATVPESSGAAARRQDAEDAASRGNMKQTAAAIVGSIGVVGAVVGGMLFLRHDDREGRTSASTSRLHVGATPLPGGASASAFLRF